MRRDPFGALEARQWSGLMETRAEYHRQLRDLAQQVIEVGRAVLDNIGRATDALVDHDLGLVDDVLAADDFVDDAQARLLSALTDTSVDHRTIIALTIAGRCYERVADHAVNLAARSGLVVGAVLTP